MALSFLLTAFGIAATAASFVGGVAPASVPRSCLTRPAVAGRCVSPLLKEPNDDAMGPDMPGDESQWSSADDAALAEYARACSASAARCGRPQEVLREFSAAWVLIFNLGKSNEGVYTLQGRGSTNAYVLAFESMYDADRFSQLLQAENFDLPTPLRWNTPQLSDFCTAGEFEVSLVPQGALITPPSKNEYDLEAFEREARAMEREANRGDQEPIIGEGEERVDAYAAQREAFERLFRSGPDGPDDGYPPDGPQPPPGGPPQGGDFRDGPRGGF